MNWAINLLQWLWAGIFIWMGAASIWGEMAAWLGIGLLLAFRAAVNDLGLAWITARRITLDRTEHLLHPKRHLD